MRRRWKVKKGKREKNPKGAPTVGAISSSFLLVCGNRGNLGETFGFAVLSRGGSAPAQPQKQV